MGKVKTHYNIDSIDKLGALINIIFGMRSNGKSYQVKHKKGVIPAVSDTIRYVDPYYDKGNIIKSTREKGGTFMLVRRWREEITTDLIEKYFDDVDVEGITDGKYNYITVYRKQIFFANYNHETNKVSRGERIGYVVALSTEQKYAGGSYLDVTDIIFEEFMSRGVYLAHEPSKLMNLFSTVDRQRGYVRMWLVGNTITRICPYLVEWGLLEMIKSMKKGEIKEKWLPTGEVDEEDRPIEVKIAFEWCNTNDGANFIIGEHKEMLNSGEWQVESQPHLSKSRKEYKMLYRIVFFYQSFKFIGEYLLDPVSKDTCWFIKPYEGEIKEKTLVFSDRINTSRYYQRDIYNPSIKNDKICNLLRTFKENKIFYSSDLCGTDFKQAIDFEIRK